MIFYDQQLSELENLELEARNKNRKGEKRMSDLSQNVKKLELRNKTLLDEVNNLVSYLLIFLAGQCIIQICIE